MQVTTGTGFAGEVWACRWWWGSAYGGSSLFPSVMVIRMLEANQPILPPPPYLYRSQGSELASEPSLGALTRTALTACCLLGLMVSACDSSVDPAGTGNTPDSITLSVDSLRFEWLGESQQIGATVRSARNAIVDAPVLWSSGDPEVAVVDSEGAVTAIGNGATRITANAGTVSASAYVEVGQRVSALVVTPDSIAFSALGDSVQLAVVATDRGGSSVVGAEPRWSSADSSVTRVNGLGFVIARDEGASQVFAELDDLIASASITVEQRPASVEVTPESVTVTWIGAPVQFSGIVVDANGFPLKSSQLTWSSDLPGVATIGTDGLAMAVGPGVAAISASSGNRSASAVFTVAPTAAGLSVSPSALQLQPGAVDSLSAMAVDSGGTVVEGLAPVWNSSNPSVASVSQTGVVTGISIGTVTVTVTVAGLSASIPVTVVSGSQPLTNPSRITAGGAFSCALQQGQAYCWGQGSEGQLGTGGLSDESKPVAVASELRFSHIVAGGFHACALTTTGSAYCWGNNPGGQLGDGTTTNRSVPTAVLGNLAFVKIAANTNHTCGLTSTGEAYCWGWEALGMLGNGSQAQVPQSTPIPVVGGLQFSEIAAGAFATCAVTTGGKPYCWGKNHFSELGNVYAASTESRPVFVADPSLPFQPYQASMSQISVGSFHACGLTSTGVVQCWGRNDRGQVGYAGTTPGELAFPNNVAGLSTSLQVTVMSRSSCALDALGAAYCWGDNTLGQLGDGSTQSRATPAPAAVPRAFTSIDIGYSHGCGLLVGGGWYCWGDNSRGALGTG